MKAFYISHPYTGDEDTNRDKSILIAAKLAKEYPNILFVNPLAALFHTGIAELDYDAIMRQCKELLSRCDGVIMAGNWQESKGCKQEFEFACENKMLICVGIDGFREAVGELENEQ